MHHFVALVLGLVVQEILVRLSLRFVVGVILKPMVHAFAFVSAVTGIVIPRSVVLVIGFAVRILLVHMSMWSLVGVIFAFFSAVIGRVLYYVALAFGIAVRAVFVHFFRRILVGVSKRFLHWFRR